MYRLPTEEVRGSENVRMSSVTVLHSLHSPLIRVMKLKFTNPDVSNELLRMLLLHIPLQETIWKKMSSSSYTLCYSQFWLIFHLQQTWRRSCQVRLLTSLDVWVLLQIPFKFPLEGIWSDRLSTKTVFEFLPFTFHRFKVSEFVFILGHQRAEYSYSVKQAYLNLLFGASLKLKF